MNNVLEKLKGLIRGQFVNRSSKVRWLTWEVTDACNSRCELCNIWKTKTSPDIITLEEAKRIFTDPLFIDLECILLTGGEPVLKEDLLDIILFIHQILPKVRFTLSTNALLPDKVLEVVKTALEKGIIMDVGISLDGIGEHHDKIRGCKGNFEKVDYLVHKLNELKKDYADKLFVVVGLTLHPQTINYVKEVEEYAKKMDVHYLVQLYDEAPYYHNIGESNAAEKLDSERKNMLDAIKGLRPSLHDEVLRKILKERLIKFDCYTMRTFFILRCNGDIMPCLRLCDVKIGNVKKTAPSEVWNSQKANEVKKMVRECKGCANTWATDWSMNCNLFPFIGLLSKYAMRKMLSR